MNDNEIQEGFDAINYPCDFAFKAMCRNLSDIDIEQQISDYVCASVAGMKVLKSQIKESKKGSFVSITMTMNVKNKTQLEAVYTALYQHPHVLMTL